MSLPLFYAESLEPGISRFFLNEETSKHLIQVLRIREGEQLKLTNGRGTIVIAEMLTESRKAVEVKIIPGPHIKPNRSNITVAISLIKNSSRFEWFAEKATEIGIARIIPLVCERTEKQQFRYDRVKGIIVSAMLQSQQGWLPMLGEPLLFKEFIKQSTFSRKYIAHCIDEEKTVFNTLSTQNKDALILIGPEGDFTRGEVDAALNNDFIPVSLGQTRLRTETAGVVACVLLTGSGVI